MRTYDCQHRTINSLEKELLFKEVMMLRNRIVDAEQLLMKIKDIVNQDDVSLEVDNFLKL